MFLETASWSLPERSIQLWEYNKVPKESRTRKITLRSLVTSWELHIYVLIEAARTITRLCDFFKEISCTYFCIRMTHDVQSRITILQVFIVFLELKTIPTSKYFMYTCPYISDQFGLFSFFVDLFTKSIYMYMYIFLYCNVKVYLIDLHHP